MKSRLNRLLPIAVLFFAAAAIAEGFGGHRGPHDDFADPDRFVEHMIRRLELDDVQAQSVRNIVEAARPELDSLRERAWANHKAVRELETTDPDYAAKLQNLASGNGELATQATLLHGRLRAQIHEQLTPEQRAKLAEMGPRFGARPGKRSPTTE